MHMSYKQCYGQGAEKGDAGYHSVPDQSVQQI